MQGLNEIYGRVVCHVLHTHWTDDPSRFVVGIQHIGASYHLDVQYLSTQAHPIHFIISHLTPTEPKKISTSAPRDSRRESWRLSKGLSARPKSRGQNKQLTATGKHKAGRTKRRR